MNGDLDPIETSLVEVTGYGDLFEGVAGVIRETHHRVVRTTNTAVLSMYWQIGRLILDRQATEAWGAKVLDRLAVDLRAEFPTRRGFSRSNLHAMRSFAQAWPDGAAIVQQPVGQLPWGHVVVLIQRLDDPQTREFYAARAAENGWSRAVLEYQISTRFHLRLGQAPSNFATTIPTDQQDVTRELAVDPYRLDLLAASGTQAERDLEDLLVSRMTEFVAAVGVGLAYLGRQYRLLAGTTAPMAVAAYAWEDLPEDLRHGLPPAEDLDRAIHQVVRTIGRPDVAAEESDG